jgi:hypothetical protein
LGITVSTSFVAKADDEKGSQAKDARPTISDLDDTMGVMPIVAPHMENAMAQLEDADRQRLELQQIINDLEANAPTLYVEGKSDYIVVNALINAMNVDPITPVTVAEPPQRAGVQYVVHMLQAWEYKAKALNGAQPKAIGFVDCDTAGHNEFEKFNEKFTGKKNPKHVKLLKLPTSGTVSQAHACGLQFANCLEELFPSDWWAHADEQGWLWDRDPKDLFSVEALNKALDERTTKADLYEGKDWELHTKRCILDEHKVAFATWVAELDPDTLLTGLDFFRNVVVEQLKWMDVNLVEDNAN